MSSKKWSGLVVLGVVVAVAARKCVSSCRSESADTAEARQKSKWDKMRDRMEQMPEDFPPRVMFDNVQKTRENTDRILEVLETAESQRPDVESFAGAVS